MQAVVFEVGVVRDTVREGSGRDRMRRETDRRASRLSRELLSVRARDDAFTRAGPSL